ncbi:TetR/AcrR family transcriptional regulator [Actinopolyspora erythraea]|uniref:TetR/AcrR family transcriptional regulator n=1 Tax=Actinopolyspora erythraea TaxID=414996 RepID=A0A223RNU7_9ACTN|nr:TetR/AcrR family transcriptional regulator [Actinopolyspora erythraea]ASU77425.1 TetR/AcrR family transcriptional regulator [Actinopolyspora erythraea]
MSDSRPVEGVGEPRGTAQKPAVHARRAELLDRLCDLFLAEGFAHFTLDELAGRMHCSKSTLYTLAPSKEQLAVRVVGYFFKRSTANMERQIAEYTDPRSRMRTYLKAAAAELAPASRRFIGDMADNPATRASYEANARAAADRIRRDVHEGVRAGVFREVDAALVAEMVGLTISAIQRGEITDRTGLSDAAAFDALSDFLVGGLSASKAEPVRGTGEQSTEES